MKTPGERGKENKKKERGGKTQDCDRQGHWENDAMPEA